MEWIALFGIAFAQASFFPVLPDLLLIPLALANPKMALGYALMTLFGSILGGVSVFFLGYKGGRPLLHRLLSTEKTALIQGYLKKYDAWAIGLSALLPPLPYRSFAIASGVFGLDFKRFLVASLIGRASRFFSLAILILIFGEKIRTFLSGLAN